MKKTQEQLKIYCKGKEVSKETYFRKLLKSALKKSGK